MSNDLTAELQGFSLFCDDVREEKSGKLTYVGVYNDLMRVEGDLPLVLPMLHIVVHMYATGAEVFEEVNLSVVMPSETEGPPLVSFPIEGGRATHTDAANDLMKSGSAQHVSVRIRLSPLKIENPGLVRVFATREEETVLIGSLAIVSGVQNDSGKG